LSGKTKATYHHGDLRKALLARGTRPVLQNRGWTNLRCARLARNIGVTHGAVYRHFSDKRERLVALALIGHADLSQNLKSAVSMDDDVEASIAAVAKAYVRWSLSNDSLYQIMFGPRLNEDARYADLEVAIEKTFRAVEGLFARSSLAKASRRDLSVLLMTQLHGYCDLVRLRRIRVRGDKAAEAYLMKCIAPLVQGICAEIS